MLLPTYFFINWCLSKQDINFGEKFSKEFVDSREDDQSPEGLMNLHNNEAGRRVSWLLQVNERRICETDLVT